jgi:hypothetical protein
MYDKTIKATQFRVDKYDNHILFFISNIFFLTSHPSIVEIHDINLQNDIMKLNALNSPDSNENLLRAGVQL